MKKKTLTHFPRKALRPRRGRPPGTGSKQMLQASAGEWMSSSAGSSFKPHVIEIEAGEDIAAKILSIAQEGPRLLSILSAFGTVSLYRLHGGIGDEGLYQIVTLSGSYVFAEEGGTSDRTGGLSVSLSTPDGHIIGGAVEMLIAAKPAQVVACSFKMKKQPEQPKNLGNETEHLEENSAPETEHPEGYTPTIGACDVVPRVEKGDLSIKTESPQDYTPTTGVLHVSPRVDQVNLRVKTEHPDLNVPLAWE